MPRPHVHFTLKMQPLEEPGATFCGIGGIHRSRDRLESTRGHVQLTTYAHDVSCPKCKAAVLDAIGYRGRNGDGQSASGSKE